MSQALSEEEFHRMQAQLLELRTQNYQLSDDLRKSSAELNAVRQKTSGLERDYVKAQKALNKSKKAQEVEALLAENEMLQNKLHSQEDDFRLQNSTLMTELSKLCTQIEQLEQENQGLKERGGASETSPSPFPACDVDKELLRLQAENSVLQKRLTDLQEHYHQEQDRRTVAQGSATTETDGPTGTNGVSDVNAKGEESIKQEKVSKQAEVTKLQDDISKLTEKLRKKQESFQRLQGEKEALYNDSRTKMEEISQRKEEELRALGVRVSKLQADLTAANQTVAELRDQIQSQQRAHDLAIHTHTQQDQAENQNAVSQEQVDNILQENDALRTNLAALEQIQTVKTQEFTLLREQQGALLVQIEDLTSQLQESSFSSRKLLDQLTQETQERERLLRELDESRKTAEKRKLMLDDLAIQLSQAKSDHKEALSDLKLQHEKEVLGVRARYEKELRGLHEEKQRSEEEIRQQLREEKAHTKELEGLRDSVDDLFAQIKGLEATKSWLERQLTDSEETIKKNSVDQQQQMDMMRMEHTQHLEEKDTKMEAVRHTLQEVEKQRDQHCDTIEQLRQEIKDTVDGQRILEKKGGAALKDLKRQLQSERRRADKLQERLQEILTNSKTRSGLEELVLSESSSPIKMQQTGDSSSVSSFSYRDLVKETAKGGGASPQSQRPGDLSDEEVGELFQRLAQVQQEKWHLEEKVKHLEVSCSSMAEDICRKSSIIETYVMDSRIDVSAGAPGGAALGPPGERGERGGLGSVLRELVKHGDDNLREMNKKLQNMLEEQLTKNMHLQKNLEDLSQELVRLSKDSNPGDAGLG